MAKVRTATFNGITYDIVIGKFDGYTDTDDRYSLVIQRDLNKRIGLETVIHEALHSCSWHAKEEKVEVTARDIARFLWRLGYRVRKGII